MSEVKKRIALLQREYRLWKKLITDKIIEQYPRGKTDTAWTIKDVLAHLTSWQQITFSRLTAARENGTPCYPDWFPGYDPENDKDLDTLNDVIFHQWKDKPWKDVVQEWDQRFQGILRLCSTIPENDFLEIGKYPWLGEYPLLAVINGTLGHHYEHRETLWPKGDQVFHQQSSDN